MADDLSGLRILVVEDDFLIAMDIKEAIERVGGRVVGPIGRLEQAQALARQEQFDAAIPDVKLDGDVTFPLAEELLMRGVPFALATGYDLASLPEKFQSVPHLRKPFRDAEVRRLALMYFRRPQSQCRVTTQETAGRAGIGALICLLKWPVRSRADLNHQPRHGHFVPLAAIRWTECPRDSFGA